MELPQIKEKREILLKKIYDYCIKVNWQMNKLEELAIELDFTSSELKELALTYASEHTTPKEYEDLCIHLASMADVTPLHYETKLNIVNPILLEKTGKITYFIWETKEEREIVLKYIYEYCINVNWSKLKLDELAIKLDINTTRIKKLAKQYAKKNLNPEEYNALINKINTILATERNLKKLTLPIINPILLKKANKTTYLLWENEEDKELVLKYIYYYCKNFKFAKYRIDQLSKFIRISSKKIKELCKEYALKYLKLSEEQYKQILNEYIEINKEDTRDRIREKAKNRDSKSKVIYDALLNASTLEEIIKILDKDDMSKGYILCSAIPNYIIIYHNGDEKIKEELKGKIKMYTDYISNLKKEQKQEQKEKEKQEKTTIAITTISSFINDTECNSIEYFCKKNAISKKEFTIYVDIVSEINFELFSQYDSKVTIMQQERYIELTKKIKQIVMYLKIGIKEHGVVRPFDIIDYFLITKIPIKDILRVAEEFIAQKDYNILKKFVNKNIDATNNNPNIINQIMSEEIIINYQKDNNGNPIPGTEVILSNLEKTKIIKFLNQNKIPLNSKTYYVAYNRYVSGTLNLNLTNKSK